MRLRLHLHSLKLPWAGARSECTLILGVSEAEKLPLQGLGALSGLCQGRVCSQAAVLKGAVVGSIGDGACGRTRHAPLACLVAALRRLTAGPEPALLGVAAGGHGVGDGGLRQVITSAIARDVKVLQVAILTARGPCLHTVMMHTL